MAKKQRIPLFDSFATNFVFNLFFICREIIFDKISILCYTSLHCENYSTTTRLFKRICTGDMVGKSMKRFRSFGDIFLPAPSILEEKLPNSKNMEAIMVLFVSIFNIENRHSLLRRMEFLKFIFCCSFRCSLANNCRFPSRSHSTTVCVTGPLCPPSIMRSTTVS